MPRNTSARARTPMPLRDPRHPLARHTDGAVRLFYITLQAYLLSGQETSVAMQHCVTNIMTISDLQCELTVNCYHNVVDI